MSTFVNGLSNWFQGTFFSAPIWAQIVVVGVGAIVGIAIFAGILWIAWKTFKWFGSKISSWPTWLKVGMTIITVMLLIIVVLVLSGKLWIGNEGSVTTNWKFNTCSFECGTPSATAAAPAATPLPTSTPIVAPATIVPTSTPSATPIAPSVVVTATVAAPAAPVATATMAAPGTH